MKSRILLKTLNYWKWMRISILMCSVSALGFNTCREKNTPCPIQYCWFYSKGNHPLWDNTSVIQIFDLPIPIQILLLCLLRTVGLFLLTFHIGYPMIMIKHLLDILRKLIYGSISILFFNSLTFQYIPFSFQVKMNWF